MAIALTCLVAIGSEARAQTGEYCYGPDCSLPPHQWADEFPTCAGVEQSPIDISHSRRARPAPGQLDFRYRETELTVLNTGHTVEVEYEDDGRNHIRVGKMQCRLLQFHFHTRSEHTVGGVSFPIEAHLVHGCPGGRLLVVGVLMDHFDGEANSALQVALDNAPFDRVSGRYVEGESHVSGVTVNAADLLPRSRAYFTYDGSLTTPGCGEVVDWYVLGEPARISERQVMTLRQLIEDTSVDHFPQNNRPVQDLGSRLVHHRGAP